LTLAIITEVFTAHKYIAQLVLEQCILFKNAVDTFT